MLKKFNSTKLQKLGRAKRQDSLNSVEDRRISDLWQLGLIGKIIEKLKAEENDQLPDQPNG